jgi:hypothetical protein
LAAAAEEEKAAVEVAAAAAEEKAAVEVAAAAAEEMGAALGQVGGRAESSSWCTRRPAPSWKLRPRGRGWGKSHSRRAGPG